MQPSLVEESYKLYICLDEVNTCVHARTGLAVHFVAFEKFSWLLLNTSR